MNTGINIEFPFIIGNLFNAVQLPVPIFADAEDRDSFAAFGNDEEISERLVMALILGNSCHHFIGQVLCFGYPALTDQLSDLGNAFTRIRIDAVTGAAPPYAVIIQLETVDECSAVAHRSQKSVSERKCPVPVICRLVIP